ncbi:MAG: hypothetical protein GOV00_00760 [Candidatus Altiarchaeota archaeon]|nr:hypothetical protein [Candidatus Altiarchaeota archaeon]
MIEARFIIESQGKPASYVNNSLKKHVEAMKGLSDLEVFDVAFEDAEEVEDGFFSALVDVGIRAGDFETFFAAILGFAPTAVILQKPEKITVEMRELQNVSNDVITMFHRFAQANEILRRKAGVEKLK